MCQKYSKLRMARFLYHSKKGGSISFCALQKQKRVFSTSGEYREVMALPAHPILDIPQRLAEINLEIQNMEDDIRNTQRRGYQEAHEASSRRRGPAC